MTTGNYVKPSELAKVLGTTQNNLSDFAKRHTGRVSLNPSHPKHPGRQNLYGYEHALLVYIAYKLMKFGFNGGTRLREVCDWLRDRWDYSGDLSELWPKTGTVQIWIHTTAIEEEFIRKLLEVRAHGLDTDL